MKIYVTTGLCQLISNGMPGPNCVEAESVVEPLAITADVLMMRGEWELQRIGHDWYDIQVTGPDSGKYLTGQIVEVVGTDFGNFVGKIISVAYTASIGDATVQVTLNIRRLRG